jgi:putative FmdB family regulatory protein
MPTYQFRCLACLSHQQHYRKMAERDSFSTCHDCGAPAGRIQTPTMVRPLFQPYRAVGGDRRMITSEHGHRDFLKEYGYTEVGNDKSMAPPSEEEWLDHQREQIRQLREDLPQIEMAPGDVG